MNSSGNPDFSLETWANRIRAMERDLQFLQFLFSAPVYQVRRPNLFERLQQLGQQADELKNALQELDPGQPDAVMDFEDLMRTWKSGVYEFLESSI